MKKKEKPTVPKVPKRIKVVLEQLDRETSELDKKIKRSIPYSEAVGGLSADGAIARAAKVEGHQTGEWIPKYKELVHTPNEELEGVPCDDDGNLQLNKKELLARGWTRTAIDKLLGEPDRKRPTKYRGKTRLESLYTINRVLEAEATAEFEKIFEGSAYRATLDYYAPGIRVTAMLLLEVPPADLGKEDQLILQWHFVEEDTIEEVARKLGLSRDSIEVAKRRILQRPAFDKFFRRARRDRREHIRDIKSYTETAKSYL